MISVESETAIKFKISRICEALVAVRYASAREICSVHDGEEQQIVNQRPKTTELTAFFKYSRENPQTQVTSTIILFYCAYIHMYFLISQVKYIYFPKELVCKKATRVWKCGQRGFQGSIGHLHIIHPMAGDEFYL